MARLASGQVQRPVLRGWQPRIQLELCGSRTNHHSRRCGLALAPGQKPCTRTLHRSAGAAAMERTSDEEPFPDIPHSQGRMGQRTRPVTVCSPSLHCISGAFEIRASRPCFRGHSRGWTTVLGAWLCPHDSHTEFLQLSLRQPLCPQKTRSSCVANSDNPGPGGDSETPSAPPRPPIV